jgi:hypothetical protein
MEVVLFQLIYSIFQFFWTGLLVPYYFGISIINSMFTGSYGAVFLVTNLQRFKEVFLSAGFCVGVGLILILFLILLVISPQIDRIQNFFNRQSLFAFVSSNRWFGSNFFPDSSVFLIFARVIHVRVRAFESTLRRLESVIVFTSQLRLDPKQVDLSYW